MNFELILYYIALFSLGFLNSKGSDLWTGLIIILLGTSIRAWLKVNSQ